MMKPLNALPPLLIQRVGVMATGALLGLFDYGRLDVFHLMLLVLREVEQGWKVSVDFCLVHILDYHFDVFLILKSIPDVLKVNELLWAEQIGVIVSEFQNIGLLSGVEDEANFFLKFHRDNVNGLVCGLEERYIVQGKEAFLVDFLGDR
jgi:hypothetical protein